MRSPMGANGYRKAGKWLRGVDLNHRPLGYDHEGVEFLIVVYIDGVDRQWFRRLHTASIIGQVVHGVRRLLAVRRAGDNVCNHSFAFRAETVRDGLAAFAAG